MVLKPVHGEKGGEKHGDKKPSEEGKAAMKQGAFPDKKEKGSGTGFSKNGGEYRRSSYQKKSDNPDVLYGRDFECFKFRTMRVNADADTMQAVKDDPRKTRIGNFLRKSNLDEFPQFVNVFLGDMSVVGPRPHMLKHTEQYSALIDKYMVRHLVKPGVTGWAQVTGYRGETKTLEQMEGRVKRDVWYIENWTFFLDLKIIIVTVLNMFKGEKNAY